MKSMKITKKGRKQKEKRMKIITRLYDNIECY